MVQVRENYRFLPQRFNTYINTYIQVKIRISSTGFSPYVDFPYILGRLLALREFSANPRPAARLTLILITFPGT